MKKTILGAAIAAFGFYAPASSAEAHVTFEFTYPGTQCNTFGSPGMGPNGGVELVNWSNPHKVIVECPFPHDSTRGYIEQSMYVTVRGNVTCSISAVAREGGGYSVPVSSVARGNGFSELKFNAAYTNIGNGIYGTALECLVAPGGVLASYRVNVVLTQDPGHSPE